MTRTAPLLLVAGAMTTGCLGDLFQPFPAAPAPPAAARAATLWDLAPADAVEGMVVNDGAFARLLALTADPDRSDPREALEELLQKRGSLPFDPLSPEAWKGAGLDPQKGAAVFGFADKKHGDVIVLPVGDHELFRRAFQVHTRVEDGVDQLDDETVCQAVADRYLCAPSLEDIAAAAKPHTSRLGASGRDLAEHGEVEIYVTRDEPGLDRFNHKPDSPGWITAVTATIRLRDDGATLHLHADGSLATPAARGFYAGPPPPELAAAARGAPTVARIHVDPTSAFPPSDEIDPEIRAGLLDQLTGDVEVLPAGTGFAGATITFPVHDTARVLAFVKKRCAEAAAKKARDVVSRYAVQDRGCTAAIDGSGFPVPVLIPVVPVTVTVADGRLVVVVGEPGKGPGAARREGELVEGEDAKRALADAETFLFYGRNLGIGPEVSPGAMFRKAVPVFGALVADSVEAWDYVSAHLYQTLIRARVTDEGADLVLDLTSFAADPAEAQAAYHAALARRFAGDEPGYRAALAALERRFPGTRAARRAAEVQRGAPFFGAGVALMAVMSVAGDLKPKKKK